MTGLLPRPDASLFNQRAAIWVDHRAYARHVLWHGSELPWSNAGEFLAVFGQAQSMLASDVALLDLGAFYDAWLAQHPELLGAMRARSRSGYALKTLLRAEEPLSVLLDLIEVVASTQRVPAIVRLPSPARWLNRTQADTAIEADDVERAAMYVAEFLGAFARCGIAGVLLDHDAGEALPPLTARSLTPLTNVARHYRWLIASRVGKWQPEPDEAERPEIDLWFRTDHSHAGSQGGLVLGEEFLLSRASDPPPAACYLVEIPATADPVEVMRRMSELQTAVTRSGATHP